MEKHKFHHALKIDKDLCIGCSHCMHACPTEALRVMDGKACLQENRCIDCGMCYKVCPVHAIYVEQDDFKNIFDYKCRVALVPSVMIGQFPEDISTTEIYSVLMELGFTHVYEAEHGVEILAPEQNEYLAKNAEIKPLISSFCPAVVRLIQVKFPSLVEHLIHLKSPMDVAALYYKKMLIDSGFAPDEIGIFYVTPCAAKIAAAKDPVGETQSSVNGVINMNFLYNKVFKKIAQSKTKIHPIPLTQQLSEQSVCWSLTNGESAHADGRSLAIDGINNVIEFLEKLENEEINTIDFLELRACDQSCAGGALISGNRFLTVERLRNRADKFRRRSEQITDATAQSAETNIQEYKSYLSERLSVKQITPRSMMKLDEDMGAAMEKMGKVRALLDVLPGIDCGACGAPSCQALAEDVAQGNADATYCIFIQRTLEKDQSLTPDEAFDIVKKIWGKNKFKDTNK